MTDATVIDFCAMHEEFDNRIDSPVALRASHVVHLLKSLQL